MGQVQGEAGAAVKRLRLTGPWGIAATVAAAAVVLVAGLAAFQLMTSGQRAATRLSEASTLIESADRVVVEIDAVVDEEMSADLAAPAKRAAGRVDEAVGQLTDARERLAAARPHLRGQSRERATLLDMAAKARLDMLVQAPAILDANVKAAIALPKSVAAWNSVLAADKESDAAVVQYNKLTKAGVTQSNRLNSKVATELAAARRMLVEAEEALPEADFESFIAYVDVRIALNELSQESDTAWLAGDLAKANARIVKYNDTDSRGVALAKTLPVSPATVVANAYEEMVGTATDAYYAARKRATDVDSKLRGL